MTMLYKSEVFDRKTGEVIEVELGEWMTVTELGERLGVGRRKVREVLSTLDVVALTGASWGGTQRYRLTPWVLERDFGKHHPPTKARPYPFDVIGPMGREWIEERWAGALHQVETKASSPVVSAARAALEDFKVTRKRENMPTKQMVYWLCHHFPQLSHDEMAIIIGVARQMVSREAAQRETERAKWKAFREKPLRDGIMKVASFQEAD